MAYEVKVTGTNKEGRVSSRAYASNETVYEVIDDLMTGAKGMRWKDIRVYIRCMAEDAWTLVPKDNYDI